ncbi:hypothetical protein OG555_18855 [Kribbella sp. NBC_01484]|uniref:hypothetical protein n=1 Tax=Kribbella sp. NBC_01484 TaxID=2903579 RepID=UPI002E2EA5BB|nr:hypothetical protein [Kribbella sp. NBC_01484]
MNYEIISPPGVAEAIGDLASSGAVTATEDLEIDLGEATAHMVELELEYELAQHTAECIGAAITIAYNLGNDDEFRIRQAAARVLEDHPSICGCPSSAVGERLAIVVRRALRPADNLVVTRNPTRFHHGHLARYGPRPVPNP